MKILRTANLRFNFTDSYKKKSVLNRFLAQLSPIYPEIIASSFSWYRFLVTSLIQNKFFYGRILYRRLTDY